MLYEYIVYADVLFLVNLVMDYFLLWATARFGRFSSNWKRLILGAVLGAFYGVGIVFPGLQFCYALWCKVLFSFLLLLIAYGRQSLRQFAKAVGCFYLISFAMAGAALGASSFIKNNIYANGEALNSVFLLFGLVIAGVIGHWGLQYWKKNWHKASYRAQVVIYVNGAKCKLPVLLDSGNELYDPASGNPVLVVEYAAMKNFFPPSLSLLFEEYAQKDVTAILTNCRDSFWSKRLRLVPFQSLGRQHGLLLGFKPDWVVISRGGKEELQTKSVVICLSTQSLGHSEEYRGIVNIDIMAGLSLEGEV